MTYRDKVNELLEKLEKDIRPDWEEEKTERLKQAVNYEKTDRFLIRALYPDRSGNRPATMEEIHSDMDAMMYNELLKCLPSYEVMDDSIPMIRANYGTGTLPSLFGAHYKIVDNNMPWVNHLDRARIEEIAQHGLRCPEDWLSSRVSATHEHYRRRLADYPVCQKYIHIYHADLQGPFDVAHLMWGSDIYLEMYDEPELVKDFLSAVTDVYIEYMKQILKETNSLIDGGLFHYHWSSVYRGRITLREDSSVNLSREFYEEFIKPCNERIADAFAPITMHFCGRADQWVHSLIGTRNIQGLNFGYMPGKFDSRFLAFIHDACEKKQVAVQDYKANTEELKSLDLGIFDTGITYGIHVKSREEALEYLEILRQRKRR